MIGKVSPIPRTITGLRLCPPRSPLFVSAQDGHEAVLRALLERRADPNMTREDGVPALHMPLGSEMGLILYKEPYIYIFIPSGYLT